MAVDLSRKPPHDANAANLVDSKVLVKMTANGDLQHCPSLSILYSIAIIILCFLMNYGNG